MDNTQFQFVITNATNTLAKAIKDLTEEVSAIRQLLEQQSGTH